MSLAAGDQVLSFGEIEQAWLSAGGPSSQAALAASVSEAESMGGHTGAIGDEYPIDGVYAPSYGLWQIRSVHADSLPNFFPPSTEWENPVQNASAAIMLADNTASGWHNWSTYNDGDYIPYLTQNGGTPPASIPSAPTGPTYPHWSWIPPQIYDTGTNQPGEALTSLNPFSAWISGVSDWWQQRPIALLIIALAIVAMGLVMLFAQAQSNPTVVTAEKAAAAA